MGTEVIVEYQPIKESVDKHPVPDWYHDAKFGIFIHWSLCCVPAFAPTEKGNIMDILRNEGSKAMFANQPYSEWYLNSLRIKGSPAYEYHMKTYGADFDYYEFAKDFNAALDAWDPAGWADLFKQVGARYVVLVTKHHDGFLLWPSEHPNPLKPGLQASRNVVAELTEEVKARGMRIGFYYSSPYDWTFTAKPITDLAMGLARVPMSSEYREYATSHWYELIDRYDPSVLWSDIGYPDGVNINEIFAYFYNKTPDGVEIHQDQLRRYGGRSGIRDLELLKSALAMPRAGMGEEYFHADLVEMAAAYLFHIVRNHPFTDGNKRTGTVAALVFLALNGIEVEAEETEFEQLVRKVADGKAGKNEIAGFLRSGAK